MGPKVVHQYSVQKANSLRITKYGGMCEIMANINLVALLEEWFEIA